MIRILFQGDSVTESGRSYTDDRIIGYGYATMVKGVLGADMPGKYEFINRGIGGNRITDIYARIKCDIINLKPDVMSILIGVNDVWKNLNIADGVDAEKYPVIYSMLIEEIKEALPDIKIMIMEPFALKGSGNESYWDEFKCEISKRADYAKEIANKHGLKFIPLQKIFDDAAEKVGNEYWLYDGVHPTAMGYELIKREWLKAFNEIM